MRGGGGVACFTGLPSTQDAMPLKPGQPYRAARTPALIKRQRTYSASVRTPGASPHQEAAHSASGRKPRAGGCATTRWMSEGTSDSATCTLTPAISTISDSMVT